MNVPTCIASSPAADVLKVALTAALTCAVLAAAAVLQPASAQTGGRTPTAPVTDPSPAQNPAAPPQPATTVPPQSSSPDGQPVSPPDRAPAPIEPAATAPAPTAAPAPIVVEPPQIDDILLPVREATNAIETVEKFIDRVKTSDTGLAQQRVQIDNILSDAEKSIDGIKPRLDAAKAQMEQLGPGPKQGQPAETTEVRTERARLGALVSALEGAMKSAELVRVRARQAATHVAELRQALFTQNLFERAGSPLLPKLWIDALANTGRTSQQLEGVFGTWNAVLHQRWWQLFSVLGGSLVLYLALWAITRRLIAKLTPADVEQTPGYTLRARAATLTAPLYALPMVAAATTVYFGTTSFDLAYSRVEALVLDGYQSILTFAIVSALASAILTPRKPAWRLIETADRTAGSLWRSIRMIALIYGADIVLKELIRLSDLPLVFHVLLAFVTTIAFALVLLRIVLTPFEPIARIIADVPADAVPQRPSRWSPRWLKLPLLFVALAIVGAALSGYIALARFAAGQVVITGSAVVLVLLLHYAIRTSEKTAISPDTLLGAWLKDGLGLGETHRTFVGHAISAILNVGLAAVALPILLLAWGFSVADVMAGMRSAMFGFEIGHFRISLVRILMALALFGGLLFATRMLQRWLRGTFLRPDRMDAGIANSIYQGIGYVGFGFAALVGISYGGLDITNLAILAGALSVGIGFGLQSIVNNFVSGLILLVERPIKVGDWIVLKDGAQGYVRSISVRSTEIETFDRSSLIVPNSELISNIVTNWTHRNALGRVVVKVATSYKSDPEVVLAILAQCAKDTPSVMQQPAPLITLDSFGGDGLEFTVRVVVPDINRGLGVSTELRTRIFKAFAANGIEFPTASREIYLRELEGIEAAVLRSMDARNRAPATAGHSPAKDAAE